VREGARSTPADRDRVLDALRGFSLVAVVLGHVAMAMVAWTPDGTAVVGNLLASSSALQLLTWILQVIPLFFLAGGAANAQGWRRSHDRGDTYPQWLWTRVQRLYRPVLVYLAFLGIAAAVCTTTIGPASGPILALACQMLWFLGIYVMTTMLLPAMLALHDRGRWWAFIIGVPLVVVLNLGVTFWAWPLPWSFANFLLVWLLVQQLGFFWTRPPGERDRLWGWVALLGFCLPTSIALVAFGPWPTSLVGIPGESVSNMAPPSVVLLLHAGTLCSLAYLLRSPLQRWLQRPRPWTAAVAMSMTAMTVYLWHVPAMILAVLTLHLAGLNPPTQVGSTGVPAPISLGSYGLWWLGFLGVFLGYLVLIVILVWPLEHARLPGWDGPRRRLLLPAGTPRGARGIACGIGAVAIGWCTLVLSIIGFAGFPTALVPWYGLDLNAGVAIAGIVGGALLIRSAAGQSTVQPERAR